jgi:DNA-binding MarR family transcriptional regulator
MTATNRQLVLDAIYNDPGTTVAEIADETGLSEGRVRQSLDPMVAAGFVMALGELNGAEVRYVTTARAEP